MSFEKVKEIIIETVNCNGDAVTLEANLSENLGIDSLDAVELSMALEEAFEITIEDEAAEKFKLVKDIVEYVDSKIA